MPVTIDNVAMLGVDVPFQRTLQYQSLAYCPQPPPTGNNVTIEKWQQPLSKVPPRTRLNVSQAIYPIKPPPPQHGVFNVSTSYLAVRVLHYQDKFEAFAVEAPVAHTIEKWQQPLSKAVWKAPVRSAPYTPFVFVEAPRVTPAAWMQPLSRAVPPPRRNVSQVTYAAAPVAEDNTRTEWDWTASWNVAPRARPVRRTQPVYGYPYEGIDNTRTEWDWTIQWHPAVQTRRVHRTQPVFGYPYEGEDNTRFQWDWSIQWKGPPRYWPPRILAQPFVPKEATRQNTVTPDKWMQAWRGPPRYWPKKVQTPPFVAPPGATNNNITGIAWLTRFQGAVPTRPVRRTQPFFGYPYTAQVQAPTTTLEWLRAWKGPPRIRPAKTFNVPWAPGTPQEAAGAPYSGFAVQSAYLQRTTLQYQDIAYGEPAPEAPEVFEALAFDVTTSFESRRTLFYQDRTYAFPVPSVASVNVVASLTVAFGDGLRYICKAETTDGFVEQSEQLIGECDPAFQADAFQADTFQVCDDVVGSGWSDQAEVEDPWGEQQQKPTSGCCDDED